MCFYLKDSDIGIKPKIAKKDITAYKIIYKSNRGFFYNLEINNKKEKWTQGYIYSESDPFDKSYNSKEIHGRCFHSIKIFSDIIYYMKYFNTMKIVKMIIPKGSKYYENDTQYVSDTIYYPLQDKKMNLL